MPRFLHGDEARLYDELHHRVQLAVRSQVHATPDIHEDACAHAWLQFLRRQPDRDTAYAWLCTVAIHEGWRLTSLTRREPPTARRIGRAAAPDNTELALDARDALHAVATLPERQRRYFTLQLAGHSYADIVRISGATTTNVKKHLHRARTTLRAVPRPLD